MVRGPSKTHLSDQFLPLPVEIHYVYYGTTPHITAVFLTPYDANSVDFEPISDPINITKMLSNDDIFDLQKTIENEDNDLLLEHEESLRSAHLEDFDPFDPFDPFEAPF